MKAYQLIASFVVALASTASFAAPNIYNNSIPAGTAAFDTTVASVGGTVKTQSLTGISGGSSWSFADFTIQSTSGNYRNIDTSYLASGSSIGRYNVNILIIWIDRNPILHSTKNLSSIPFLLLPTKF